MRSIIKLLILVSLFYGAYQFWAKDFIVKVKEKTIEVTKKPSEKRGELLDRLESNLNEIGLNLLTLGGADSKQKNESISKIGAAIKESKSLIENIDELNKKKDGVVEELLSNVAKKIIPGSEKPTPTACPAPK